MAIKYPEKPKTLNDINGAYLRDWCIANKKVDWLKAQFVANSVETKEGSHRPNIFVIRKHWAEEFAPALIPEKKKNNKLSLYDEIMSL